VVENLRHDFTRFNISAEQLTRTESTSELITMYKVMMSTRPMLPLDLRRMLTVCFYMRPRIALTDKINTIVIAFSAKHRYFPSDDSDEQP
jgi:hypothetical protein